MDPSSGRSPEAVAAPLVARIRSEIDRSAGPLFVGLDGRSGGGKSTVASVVRRVLAEPDVAYDVSVIVGDDFYAGGSAATWDERTPAQKADEVIDWRRQRDVLEQLRERGVAEWHPFDWEADDWDGDEVPLSRVSVRTVIAPVVLLEGAYSCRPELHDMLDLRVLLHVPTEQRRRQLLDREGEHYRADWEGRWSAAEEHYFGTVMPPAAFDLVLGDPVGGEDPTSDR